MVLCNPMQEYVPCMTVTSGVAKPLTLQVHLLLHACWGAHCCLKELGPDTPCNFKDQPEPTCV